MHKHHTMRRHSLTTAIALTLAFGVAGTAFAQDATAPAQDTTQTPQELDVITVTANKREENIREVAVAITKIDAQQLENLNATQITDFANYVPGFQVQSYGSPGQTQVSMRGIAALSASSVLDAPTPTRYSDCVGSGFFIVYLIRPPIAPAPYSVPCGPRSTSTLSTS